MGPVQWGDVPTWVASGFAGAAAWFAFQTIRSQRQQIGEQQQFIAEQTQFMAEQTRFMGEQQQNLELERAELRAAADDRRRAQAERVSMSHQQAQQGTEGAGYWRVKVRNGSSAPIHDLHVRFGTAYIASEVYEISPAGQLLERWMHPLHLLGANRTAEFHSQAWPAATVHNNRPTLFFTDENGARWTLDSYGELELTEDADGS
ncbi:hypothetical protein [Streptomyces sp. SID161]|uniref:hypothetical protein n=1 Tax=Streptomyces sp. SID161 TaxID=2690251 RepID=UPI0013700EB9|nr:hypothetical protein [Streptomyces sp. SID161]MYW48870.1 hypothetical protein [Streptomyces sp. SID161]MYW49845.1 hypothetical protein [Streptomyces sp. SID161]